MWYTDHQSLTSLFIPALLFAPCQCHCDPFFVNNVIATFR